MKTQQKRITARLGSTQAFWVISALVYVAVLAVACQPLPMPPAAEAEPTAEMAEETEAGIDQLIGDAEAGA